MRKNTFTKRTERIHRNVHHHYTAAYKNHTITMFDLKNTISHLWTVCFRAANLASSIGYRYEK